jgi:transcriptional regulator with XRE-family HTH domain
MDVTSDSIDTALGERIKALRLEARLTLDQLAARTGISRAMLSRVERGESSPTAQLLNRLCAGLGVTLSALFAAAASTASPVRRRRDQTAWRDPGSGYVRRVVSPADTGSGTEIIAVDFPAGAEVAFAPHLSGVDQHVWILEGGMQISVGEETYDLAKGDCLLMQIDRPVAFRNPHDRPAQYAVVLSRGGGR